MAIRFYTWPMSSGTRVHWALEELGVPYEMTVLDRSKGEHKAPAYLAINPNGRVPALVDGDEKYFESGAILVHLGEKYGVERRLWPNGGQARADALCWSVWTVAELNAYMMQYVYHGVDSPVSYKPDQRSRACAEYNLANFTHHAAMVEQRLADRAYLLGADFSLLDVAVSSSLAAGLMFGVKIEGHPRLHDWLGRCRSRPALARVLAAAK